MGGGAGAVVGVQFRGHQPERGEAAGHVADVADLGGGQGAAEERTLAVGEPLLQHLVAADGESPDSIRDVPPVRHRR